MAPHSSTLPWKIPWTEEPGGLQSMGSQTERLHFHFLWSLMQLTACNCGQKPAFLVPGDAGGGRGGASVDLSFEAEVD